MSGQSHLLIWIEWGMSPEGRSTRGLSESASASKGLPAEGRPPYTMDYFASQSKGRLICSIENPAQDRISSARAFYSALSWCCMPWPGQVMVHTALKHTRRKICLLFKSRSLFTSHLTGGFLNQSISHVRQESSVLSGPSRKG